MKKIVFLIFAVLIVSSCEDKKKENETVTTKNKDTTTVSIPESIKKKLNKEKFKDTLDQVVSLTNETLEEFLHEYGNNNPERFVTLETSQGNIKLELYTTTPIHRAHFIYLIKNGYLNTTVFHRVVKDFIIQGGNSDRIETSRMRSKMGEYTLPPEIKYKHNRGALASAKEYRDNPDDRSAPFEFYIVQSAEGAHHLNPNYTVFGKVISGMAVVDKIANLKTDEGDWPLYNVFINAVIND
ncbi:peptidylprolyl isomerase [uncultured Planktosalinus sp.]|uniref:peptidylprolyl isomerase n=1 Tax=uncultured Planktosalinus sp. TaxID=1810935 RepID=UPI0030D84C42